MRSGRLLPLSLLALLAGGQLVAIVAGRELWPFTCAPMFAHAIPADAPVYDLALVLERAGGEQPLRFGDLGMEARLGGRFMFAGVYGSADPAWPIWPKPGDDRAALEARLSAWMGGLVEVLEARRPDLAAGLVAVRLEVVSPRRQGPGLQRVLGRYALVSRSYRHTWSADGR